MSTADAAAAAANLATLNGQLGTIQARVAAMEADLPGVLTRTVDVNEGLAAAGDGSPGSPYNSLTLALRQHREGQKLRIVARSSLTLQEHHYLGYSGHVIIEGRDASDNYVMRDITVATAATNDATITPRLSTLGPLHVRLAYTRVTMPAKAASVGSDIWLLSGRGANSLSLSNTEWIGTGADTQLLSANGSWAIVVGGVDGTPTITKTNMDGRWHVGLGAGATAANIQRIAGGEVLQAA